MIALSRAVVLSFVFATLGCQSPVAAPDGGTDCVAACAALERNHCEEGSPTPKGVPCETWLCASDSINASCIAASTSCDVARACH